MVQKFSCTCHNVTVHYSNLVMTVDLSKQSSSTNFTPSMHFLAEEPKIGWKIQTIVELALAGIQKTHSALTETIHAKGSNEEMRKKYSNVKWDVTKCRNCDTLLCAVNPSLPTKVILNGSINQGNPEEILKSLEGYVYSPVFKIILQKDSKFSNLPLEMPSESETEAFEAFTQLQRQLEQALKDEEKDIEKRVELMRQKELRNLEMMQTQAFLDRKLLWHKTCEMMGWNRENQPEENKMLRRPRSHNAASEEPPLPTIRLDEDEFKPKPSTSTPTLPKTENVELGRRLLSSPSGNGEEKSATMFDFEEDTPRILTIIESPPPVPINGNEDEESDEKVEEAKEKQEKKVIGDLEVPVSLNDDEEENVPKSKPPLGRYHPRRSHDDKEEERVLPDSISLLGTSVPISIPSAKKASSVNSRQTQKDKDVLLSRQLPALSEEENSTSFDVPRSLNRRVVPLL
eukprot:TRINITY_DN2650_c1_g1_i1.p1 TRINITY_DN2650_c1_g1~~TRINITY_DN2650_c1_g1_i1.p1  ORF type:complete len:458 (+),score=162.07 TRINITY_DN2650_c1_g1_i1:155-1528(+)